MNIRIGPLLEREKGAWRHASYRETKHVPYKIIENPRSVELLSFVPDQKG